MCLNQVCKTRYRDIKPDQFSRAWQSSRPVSPDGSLSLIALQRFSFKVGKESMQSFYATINMLQSLQTEHYYWKSFWAGAAQEVGGSIPGCLKVSLWDRLSWGWENVNLPAYFTQESKTESSPQPIQHFYNITFTNGKSQTFFASLVSAAKTLAPVAPRLNSGKQSVFTGNRWIYFALLTPLFTPLRPLASLNNI